MSASEALGRGADLRKAPRKRVFLSGKIAYGKFSFSTDCTIRDISDSGARVSLPKGHRIPDDVYLINMKSGMGYEARVAWRNTPLAGLMFLQCCGLSEAASAQMKLLRQLWAECLPR